MEEEEKVGREEEKVEEEWGGRREGRVDEYSGGGGGEKGFRGRNEMEEKGEEQEGE